jgi:hypothetical protein
LPPAACRLPPAAAATAAAPSDSGCRLISTTLWVVDVFANADIGCVLLLLSDAVGDLDDVVVPARRVVI